MAYAPHGSRKDRKEETRENLLPPLGACDGAYAIRPYNLPAGDVVSNKFSGRKDRNEDAGENKAIDIQWRRMAYALYAPRRERCRLARGFFGAKIACCHLARQALGGNIFTRKVAIEDFRRK